MYSTTRAFQPLVPSYHLRILSPEQLEQLRSATLEILEKTGIHCPSGKGLDIYAGNGAQVDLESKIVKLPPDVVLDSLSHAPRYYTMGARSPDHDIKLDGTAFYCATDGSGTKTIDFETRRLRSSVKSDVAKTARLADYLSSISFYWPMVSAQDYPVIAPSEFILTCLRDRGRTGPHVGRAHPGRYLWRGCARAGHLESGGGVGRDVVCAVWGRDGHFLRHRHTRRNMRKLGYSELTAQPSPEGGYRDPIEVAREKTDWILENHHPEPLDEAQQAEFSRILRAAERELG